MHLGRYLSLSLSLSDAARNMEIKAPNFHDMPRFYGMPNDDVMKFLKEFKNLVGRIPLIPVGVTDEDVNKKIFPKCLQHLAKNWSSN